MLTREEYKKRKQRLLYAKLAAILILGLAIVILTCIIIFR